MRAFGMSRFFGIGIASLMLGADWPQFLGPTRNNVSPESVATWQQAPKRLWSVPVGESHASPVVAHGLVYAFYEEPNKNADTLAAFDARTGAKKWATTYDRDELELLFGNGPRGTPTVDGEQVFTLGATGVLAAFEARTGHLQWKVDTLRQFQAENLVFGISGSPLVADGKVIVNVGGKGAGVVAFERATGKVAWQVSDDGASYSSPILHAGQIIVLTKQHLMGLNPRSGDIYWKVPFADKTSESATTPLVIGRQLLASSVTRGAELFDLLDGDRPSVQSVWKRPNLNCYFSTPVAVGDTDVYMLNGILSITPSITLRCVEKATGNIRWEKPNVGNYHAALIRTANNTLLMLDDKGYLTLIQPDPAAYTELARAKVCGPTWAHPALVDGKLYLRDKDNLIALDLGSSGN